MYVKKDYVRLKALNSRWHGIL